MSLCIDLHTHSTASDGTLAPAALVERAHARGVQVLALTDHDETLGLAEADARARELDIIFVPGVEVSVTWEQRTLHIVGLGIDPGHEALNQGLASIRAGRGTRAQEMARRLEKLGFADAYEGALQFVSNPALISRTHFARFLVQQGHCPNMQKVFDRFLGDGKPADVPVQWAALEDAVGWIRAAGGRAVIAHPGRYRLGSRQATRLYRQFRAIGGCSIEVITGSHSPTQFLTYARVARSHGFRASLGSDFHAVDDGRRDLGELPALPADLVPVWEGWFEDEQA
ncbi:MAG: 3',5'-nucleoside bisphosphate phosphatase [Castellaniella sp.]